MDHAKHEDLIFHDHGDHDRRGHHVLQLSDHHAHHAHHGRRDDHQFLFRLHRQQRL